MKHQHRTRPSSLLCAGSLALVAACAGSPATPSGNVTVTVTPTVTASSPGTSTSKPTAPGSDVAGRAFDFGTVVSAKEVAGVVVLELDRWTWKGLDDAKLAQQGVPVAPFKGDPPYENQNTRLTYTIPVAAGARVLQHHCLAADQPLQTKSVSADQLAALPDRENTVLVTLDGSGRATAAENVPGCPG